MKNEIIKTFIFDKIKYNIKGIEDEHIFKQINNNCFYENQLLNHIKNLKIDGIYIDIGANIGNHSLFFANHCNSKKVISFEPEEECYKLLSYNVKENSKKEILIYNLGVWDIKRELFLKKFPNHKNMGLSKIVDNEAGDTYKVQTINLDEFIGIVDKIGLIKIDVEGGELKILKGSVEIIKKFHPLIVCEAAEEKDKLILDEFLIRFGYNKTINKFNKTPTYIWKYNE